MQGLRATVACFLTCMRLILPSEKLGMIVTVSFSARNSISLESISSARLALQHALTGLKPHPPVAVNPQITEIASRFTEEFWVCCKVAFVGERRCFVALLVRVEPTEF